MDVEMRPLGDGVWEVVDLLGRTVGRVAARGGSYTVVPVGRTLLDMTPGPFLSFQAACAAVGTKVRGKCWVVPGEST